MVERGLLPYDQCEQVMERIGERYVCDSSIWRQSQMYGTRMQAEVEQQCHQVSVERIQVPDARHDHDQRKAVSMDGGMVNIRGEGWRELKVGAIFDVETKLISTWGVFTRLLRTYTSMTALI